MSSPKTKVRSEWSQLAIAVLLVPLLLVVAVFALPYFVIRSVGLHVAIWYWWCRRRRDILLVYSDSPIWHDYIEQQLLPYLGDRAVVLNWSRRKDWRFSLARAVFRHFGGSREFNPMAVVFRPFRRTRTFRFWQPFRDFKHGDPEALHRMESEFFGMIGVQRHDTTAWPSGAANPGGTSRLLSLRRARRVAEGGSLVDAWESRMKIGKWLVQSAIVFVVLWILVTWQTLRETSVDRDLGVVPRQMGIRGAAIWSLPLAMVASLLMSAGACVLVRVTRRLRRRP